MTDVRPPESPKLRIGDRVRCTTPDDPFIDHGVEGLIINVAAPRPHAPGRAYILFDTDQVCMMDATDFEVIPKPCTKPQQPVVMAPFPGSAA